MSRWRVLLFIAALLGGLTVAAAPASASVLSAKQQSQVAFVLQYLHYQNGQRPSYAEAVRVVGEYGNKVPTLAEAAVLFHPIVGLVIPRHTVEMMTGCVKNAYWTYDDGGMFGWNQYISFCYNSVANTVTSYSTYGYPWVGGGWGAFWHYDGEDSSDGYPRWVGGIEQCGYFHYQEYQFIQIFSGGYGPLTYQVILHMYVLGDADGGHTGGFWA